MLRNRGYTTWMLKSALYNPKVFIVCKDERNKHWIQSKFKHMVYELSLDTMRCMGKNTTALYDEWPKFITMDRVELSIRGYNQFIPVIFDNSCYS